MAAAFVSIVSALRRQLAGLAGRPRLTTMAWLLLILLSVGAARVDAQEIVEYYGTDAVGSVRVVFDTSGNVKARSDYLPFGEEWQAATPGGPLPSQRFTGQQRDAEEGHDNFNARTYHTRAGRMTSVDPVYSGLFAPQRWNRYAYALNNPLAYADPTGLDPIRFTDSTGVVGKPGGANNGWGGGPNDDLYMWMIFGGNPGGYGWIDPYVEPSGNGNMGIDPEGNVVRTEEVTVTAEGEGEATTTTTTQVAGPPDIITMVQPMTEGIAAGAASGITGPTGAMAWGLFGRLAAKFTVPFVAAGIKAGLLAGEKWNHIFAKSEHGMWRVGDPMKALGTLSDSLARAHVNGTLQTSQGIFRHQTMINGYVVEMTGRVVNGAPKVGTAYVIRIAR
jgi:RHS repeat-associated protein